MKVKISPELQEKIRKLKICNPCSIMKRLTDGKRHSLVVYGKNRCPLCHTRTKPYKLPNEIKAEAAKLEKALGKDAKKDEKAMEIIDLIQRRASDFDCPGSVTGIVKGPVVTEYMLTPDRFVRVRRLKTLDQDLALALKVDDVTIRTVPEQGAMAIGIPNAERAVVTFESNKQAVLDAASEMELPLNFGITSDGSPYVDDLASYPHLLIGGSTGTGKSVLLNQLICNLLMVRSPKELQLVLIDPKTVELFPYRDIPHLMRQPVSNVFDVIGVLEDVIRHMRRRSESLHINKVHNIVELNAFYKARAEELRKEGKHEQAEDALGRCWPYIVIIIDEMAEIVLENKRDFIQRLASLASMARATGISVVSATQRPSVDVLPGKVKVNFLARAAFRMPSPQDSKTVLNFKGAERLLGRGDLFVLSPDKTGLQRVHTAHCQKVDRDAIIKRVVELGYDSKGMLKDFPKKQ